ncbi:MAG: glutamate 5-kinase [Bacteroidales bacterium]|nr:glutamate 5-kinase [Bacteroidales bacterium]
MNTQDCNISLPRRVTVKIGSNVLTRADGMLDITRMSALVDDVATLRRAGVEVIMVSSGAVAAGRSELTGIETGRLDSVSARQLFSAVGQAKLIDRYVQLFREHRLTCGQVLTTKENFSTRHHYLNQQNCMEVMLRSGVVPIVNENDTVSVTELMFTDNDELSGLIAAMMRCDRLIILSNIDGVYTGDPSQAGSQLITRVAPGDDLSRYIGTSRSSAGRGGMTTKYRIARKIAAEGIEVVIANGKRPSILADLVCRPGSTPCTRFEASPGNPSGVKRWIAHSGSFAKGCLRVKPDAAETLRSRSGVSLLPVGVTAVEGDFGRGDIVAILDPDGRTIGWGKASCDAATASAAAGSTGGRALVHADYLYVDDD